MIFNKLKFPKNNRLENNAGNFVKNRADSSLSNRSFPLITSCFESFYHSFSISGNSTQISDIENTIDKEAQKLFSNSMTSADSEKEVQNWLIIAIVVTIVSVGIFYIFIG